MRLDGKTVLVTGGTDGIGAQLIRQLRDKGAVVIASGRNAERIAATRADGFEVIAADLSSPAGVEALVAGLGDRPIDILVNNAGVGTSYDFRSGEVDLVGAAATYFLNLHAPTLLTARLLPVLKARGEAMIVNVTSGLALAIDALARDDAKVQVHVVSNIDGCALEAAFKACDPATTLIAIASKTFTTTETMTNAMSALDWLRQNGVEDPYGRVVAMTAYPDKAVEWGVDETRVLPFSESVGGRYSLWSSIGFPIALALGWDDFAEFLGGAAAMDRHFLEAPGLANLPLRAACADLYYTRLRGCQTRACFVYDERLRLLPSYLQQLEMESNGKSVKIDGSPVEGPTAPITWGGVGTDAQHAVFQLLHQGTNLVPVDFIAAIIPGDSLDPAHHRNLLTNCFAQGAALMAGKEARDPARAYPGDRPSATILVEDLNPATLGALIAFHEHRTFCAGVLMQINSFDQFGVELGKEIAHAIVGGAAVFDASTEALLAEAGIK